MVKWWMRCICLKTDVTKPKQLPANEGIGDVTAKSSPGTVQISPFEAYDRKNTPFNDVSDIKHLEELLEEINKAIARARNRTVRKDIVPPVVTSTVNDAGTVLTTVCQFFQNINLTQPSGTKAAQELYRVLCDVLKGVGNLHWAAAGLSMVAFVLNRVDLVGKNSTECLNLLETMRDLGKHFITLYPQLSEQDEKLRRAICLITEGAMICCDHTSAGIVGRYGFANADRDNFLSIQNKINILYPEINLTVNETILAQTAVLMRQSSMPLSPLKPEYPTNKVGLDERVDAILQILGVDDMETLETGVRAVVLHGMGGIGKSTLGMALHARLPFKGRAHAKVEIGECPTKEKIKDYQKEILERLSGQKPAIGNYSEGQQQLKYYLKECTDPILLFIDNIFKGEDLENLLPETLELPDRSRIIVTSRDASVCAVLQEKGVTCQPYPVAELGHDQARELLCLQVFKGGPPPISKERLVNELLSICGGLPLALEVVGRYLRRHSTDMAWNSAIKSLKECRPLSGKKEDQLIQSLMFSYNQLSEDYQKAFLDITCLLADTPWDWLEPIYGEKLVTLEELALVNKINEGDGFVRLQVHDLLVALGRSLQRGTRIRSDGLDCLPLLLQGNDMVNCGSVEGLSVQDCSEPIHAEKLDAMHRSLRILILQNVPVWGLCSKNAHGLQLLCIASAGLPYKDLSKFSQLQVLMIHNPIDVEFENVKFPKHLKVLTLEEVRSLKCLPPGFGELTSVHTLRISWCPNFQGLPENSCQLKSLHTLILAGCGKLKELPRDFQRLLSLQTLDLSYCQQLQGIPSGFGQLLALQRLDLCCCKSLKNLPDDFSELRKLEFLHLGDCEGLEALPEGFGNLVCLRDLNLTRCKSLQQLPQGFENLGALEILSLEHCGKLSTLPKKFGLLYSLATLRLSNCHCIQELPESFLQLRRLSSLDVSGCPLVDKDLLEELEQQGCRVVCENIDLEDLENFEDFDYPVSPDHESNLSAYCESTDLEAEHDFDYMAS
ncbi:unnamed protein product [Calypogeia fissa]